jgi:hypothetical protein
MATPESKNHCTPEGKCLFKNGALLCSFQPESILSGRCIYQVWEVEKCMSPFALMAARGGSVPMPTADKINYCSPKGVCTAETYAQESSCAHYDQGAVNGICRKRAWCDVCCSVKAVKAAKEAAALEAAA